MTSSFAYIVQNATKLGSGMLFGDIHMIWSQVGKTQSDIALFIYYILHTLFQIQPNLGQGCSLGTFI